MFHRVEVENRQHNFIRYGGTRTNECAERVKGRSHHHSVTTSIKSGFAGLRLQRLKDIPCVFVENVEKPI